MVGLIASVGGGDALVKTEGSNVDAYSQAGVGAVARFFDCAGLPPDPPAACKENPASPGGVFHLVVGSQPSAAVSNFLRL